jgi:hypothetical protein
MRRVAILAAPIAALAALPCACEEVPTLTFTQADAASDAALEAESLSADGGPDGCVAPGNGQTYFCCGTLACEGLCTQQCGMCMDKCTPGQFCCAKNSNVVQCLPLGMLCHF